MRSTCVCRRSANEQLLNRASRPAATPAPRLTPARPHQYTNEVMRRPASSTKNQGARSNADVQATHQPPALGHLMRASPTVRPCFLHLRFFPRARATTDTPMRQCDQSTRPCPHMAATSPVQTPPLCRALDQGPCRAGRSAMRGGLSQHCSAQGPARERNKGPLLSPTGTFADSGRAQHTPIHNSKIVVGLGKGRQIRQAPLQQRPAAGTAAPATTLPSQRNHCQ